MILVFDHENESEAFSNLKRLTLKGALMKDSTLMSVSSDQDICLDNTNDDYKLYSCIKLYLSLVNNNASEQMIYNKGELKRSSLHSLARCHHLISRYQGN